MASGKRLNRAFYLLACGDKTPFALIDRTNLDARAIGLRNALGISEAELVPFHGARPLEIADH